MHLGGDREVPGVSGQRTRRRQVLRQMWRRAAAGLFGLWSRKSF